MSQNQGGQSFNTVSGGQLSQADAQAAAERGYAGVAGTDANAAAEANKPLSKESISYMRNQYNLAASGLQPGQREFAEKVLRPALEAAGVKL